MSNLKYGISAAAMLAFCVPTMAINKCTDSGGKVAFQDGPCPSNSVAARDDLSDAKKESQNKQTAAVQSRKSVAANLEAQLETELKKQPVKPYQAGQESIPVASSTSSVMPFEQCKTVVQSTVRSLAVNWKDVKRIVNSPDMVMTKICTSDDSVTITCSKADARMVTTRGARC